MSIVYRDGREDDLPYIVSTWRQCLLEGPDGEKRKQIAQDVLFKGFTDRITRLLERATVRIACDSSDDTAIVGYAVFEKGVGHFRYVRDRFRKLGIAAELMKDHPIAVCTHRSQGHAPGRMRQPYNPFLLEGR